MAKMHTSTRLLALWLLRFTTTVSNSGCSALRILPTDFALVQNATTHRHLVGTKVDVPKANAPEDHLVTDLPLLDKTKFPTDHWAGLLPASSQGDKYLFYWLFAPSETESKADEDIPLIIWLNGGPACSSMDGLWLENGPFRLQQNGEEWTIDIDEYSWHTMPAYVVYIDQPVGTGIAFTTSGKYPTNDKEVNVDFYYFLEEFLQLHADKFLKEDTTTTTTPTLKRPMYFSGESHAGHYIPSMMNYIHQQNSKSSPSPKIQIPLAGAAIGNGWMDPTVQYSAHEAAYGYGMIGLAQKRKLAAQEAKCQADLAKGNYVSRTCFALLDDVVSQSQGKGSDYTVSQYDQRKWEHKSQPRDFPPGHKDVEGYLGGWKKIGTSDVQDVLAAIHSTPSWESGQKFRECTDPPYNALKHQDGLGVTGDIVALLNADSSIKMMFFNGIHDLICNHVGNEIALENLQWNHQKEYQMAKRYGWKSASKGQLAGYMKEYENLLYLKVLDSGHMVPMDVPDVSLDMMRTLVFGESFDSFEQSIGRASQQSSSSAGASCPVCPDDPNANNKECASCPECPAASGADTTDDDDDDTTTSSSSNNNSFPDSITVPFVQVEIAAALVGLALVVCFSWLCCCRKERPTAGVPQYNLELGIKNGYTDVPEEEMNGELS